MTASRIIDLTGQRFNNLVVIGPWRKQGRRTMWRCRCDCGKVCWTMRDNIIRGSTKSCGCKKGYHLHGATKTAEHNAWIGLRYRCNNRDCPEYHNYGGRGVRVVFASFKEFVTDIGPRPTPRHSVDRIENSGNYAPGNVKWSTPKEQSRNTRSNVVLTFNGKTQCISAWRQERGLPRGCINKRLKLGWPVEKALTQPVKKGAINHA